MPPATPGSMCLGLSSSQQLSTTKVHHVSMLYLDANIELGDSGDVFLSLYKKESLYRTI